MTLSFRCTTCSLPAMCSSGCRWWSSCSCVLWLQWEKTTSSKTYFNSGWFFRTIPSLMTPWLVWVPTWCGNKRRLLINILFGHHPDQRGTLLNILHTCFARREDEALGRTHVCLAVFWRCSAHPVSMMMLDTLQCPNIAGKKIVLNFLVEKWGLIKQSPPQSGIESSLVNCCEPNLCCPKFSYWCTFSGPLKSILFPDFFPVFSAPNIGSSNCRS